MRTRLTLCLLPALLASLTFAPLAWSQSSGDPAPALVVQPVQIPDDGPAVIDAPAAGPAGQPEPAPGNETVPPAPVVVELPEDESVVDIAPSDQDLPPDPDLASDQATTTDPEIPARDEAPDATASTSSPAPASDADVLARPTPERRSPAIEVIPETQPAQAQPFRMLSGEVLPGTTARLAWSPGIQIAALSQPTPVLVVNGDKPGPVMCLTGAVHGDELNGIEIIRRVVYNLDPRELSGTLVGIPIVNLQGFQQGSRYLADRRDLNRYFPGSEDGSLAHRIAHSLFEQVILKCDTLVDIHTGSLKRTNLPQLRADMNSTEVAELTRGFDGMVVVHSSGNPGMLRTAAARAGIPAVTMEVGESMRIQEDHIDAGVNSLLSLLERQGMIARLFQWGDPEPVYYQSHWVRVNQGGILFSDVKLGAYVTEGTILGIVSDPITNEQSPVRADTDGRVIGMAVDQVVMAGFAAYHLGSRTETEEKVE